eukprot:15439586-Heterocapsa_arctica.AAC.1
MDRPPSRPAAQAERCIQHCVRGQGGWHMEAGRRQGGTGSARRDLPRWILHSSPDQRPGQSRLGHGQ